MGVVYRAIETGLDRPVALKILAGELGSDAGSKARRHWLREARAVSRVRHPNIVPLYDYGEADGCFFLVLEYVPGGSLKQRLTEPLPPRTAAGLMETIARSVGYVHGQGLFHLDLKPSNILLDGDADASWDQLTPRVADFGLAVSDGSNDVSETSLAFPRGTPSYMSPEQASANREQIGAASDIHALGAILYELLTGRPPFQGASTLETLDQVRGQNPVPPRRLNPKIPRDLETITLKCLEKSPSRRYTSAEALADDLRRWLDGKPISARPVPSTEHAWRWCRRQPIVASLAAALVLAVVGGIAGLLALLQRSVLRCPDSHMPAVLDAVCQAASRSDVGKELPEVVDTLLQRYLSKTSDKEILFRNGILSFLLELQGYCGRLQIDDPTGPLSILEADRAANASVLYTLARRPLDFLRRTKVVGGRDPVDALLARTVHALNRSARTTERR